MEAIIIKTILCVDSTDFVASVCDNRSHQITQALQLQMQVQKQLHEQLEVSLSPSILLKLSVPLLGVCNHPLPLSSTSLSLSLSLAIHSYLGRKLGILWDGYKKVDFTPFSSQLPIGRCSLLIIRVIYFLSMWCNRFNENCNCVLRLRASLFKRWLNNRPKWEEWFWVIILSLVIHLPHHFFLQLQFLKS